MAEGKDAGGFHYDTPAGENGPPAGGKRRLIREGGGATSRVRDHVRSRDPGGEAVSTVSPQQTITDDVFQTVEQSGGGPLFAHPGVLAECTKQTMAEDTQRQECPHDDDLELRPRTGTIGISEDGVPTRNIVSTYGGGVRSLPGAYRKLSSGYGYNCTCTAGQWTSFGSLAGSSHSGRGDPCRRRFLSGKGSRSVPGPRWGSGIDCFPTTNNN